MYKRQLFNYQTLITELTGLPITNASLLDEGTAAAEAMILAFNASKKNIFLVDKDVFPQTLQVLHTRAKPLGIKILTMDLDASMDLNDFQEAFGLLIQLPNNTGKLRHPDATLTCCDAVSYTHLTLPTICSV